MEQDDGEGEPASDARANLAAKIDRLFSMVRPEAKREYSPAEVAIAIRDVGGPTISSTYIWQLRTGRRDNPTKHHLEALASFFGVPAAYFLDDESTAQIDAELALLRAMRDTSIRQIALRSVGLSPASLATIADVIERVRTLEGLAESETAAGSDQ